MGNLVTDPPTPTISSSMTEEGSGLLPHGSSEMRLETWQPLPRVLLTQYHCVLETPSKGYSLGLWFLPFCSCNVLGLAPRHPHMSHPVLAPSLAPMDGMAFCIHPPPSLSPSPLSPCTWGLGRVGVIGNEQGPHHIGSGHCATHGWVTPHPHVA